MFCSDNSDAGSCDDLSDMGLRICNFECMTTGALRGKATLELPDSELCELNEVECLDSELDVLRLPSLVLERSDSMLPPLLDVAMLSVEE